MHKLGLNKQGEKLGYDAKAATRHFTSSLTLTLTLTLALALALTLTLALALTQS